MTTTKNTNQEDADTVIAEIVEMAPRRNRKAVKAVATEVVGQELARAVVAAKLPAKKAAAVKTSAKKAPAKKVAAKTTANLDKAVKAAKIAAIYDADVVIARIKTLRDEGVAWRPLSAILNDEGITTVRGAHFSANGSTAFLIAKKNGIK